MAWERKLPPGINRPSLTGSMMVDTWRGKVRVRAWPRKRGQRQTYKQRYLTQRFAEAAKLVKYAPVLEYERAVELAHGTGVYPQDLLRSSMVGGQLELEDEDGTLWRKYIPYVHPVTFQGCRLTRTSDYAFVGSAVTMVPWQNPDLDTAGFWSAGNPDRITIPENVTIISLEAGMYRQAVTNAQWVAQIHNQAGTSIARQDTELSGWHGACVQTGPFRVNAGEYYRASIYCTVNNSLTALPATYFSCTVLGAD